MATSLIDVAPLLLLGIYVGVLIPAVMRSDAAAESERLDQGNGPRHGGRPESGRSRDRVPVIFPMS